MRGPGTFDWNRSAIRLTGRSGGTWLCAVAVLVASLVLPAVGSAKPAVVVEPITNPPGVRVAVSPRSRAGWGLLQVVDAKTGECLKTLHAGRVKAGDAFAVVAGGPLAAGGAYKLRYREGVRLELVGEVRRPDEKVPAWLNPVDVASAGPSVYVRDAGVPVEGTDPAKVAEREAKLPCVFKMDRATGKADASFGNGGRIGFPEQYQFRSLAVEPATGRLFLGSGGHQVQVFEANGTPAAQVIGGWDNDPAGPKCLAWCDSVAVGADNRIIIPLPGYGNGKVYDRTKHGFDGILYRYDNPDVNGLPRMICADPRAGTVYYTGQSALISRFVDDGKSLGGAYQSAPDVKLATPTGGCASAGLVWWACHGPGFGPFWDSGGGGEVVLFWDTGAALMLVDRFGVPGTAADAMEFLNPAAVAMDAAHEEVWVAEDGLANTEGPKGNARVRRFALTARHDEAVEFELPK
jgi:hypothetical protein